MVAAVDLIYGEIKANLDGSKGLEFPIVFYIGLQHRYQMIQSYYVYKVFSNFYIKKDW